MVTGKDFNAERSRLEALMRQKGLAFADVPKRLRDEAAKITAAMTAGNFELAIRELRVLIAWAEKADVNRAFVQSKFGRLSRNSRWYLHRSRRRRSTPVSTRSPKRWAPSVLSRLTVF